MSSILAPVAAAAYKNGHLDYFGAVELDAESGDTVWQFDAPATEFQPSRLYESGQVVKQSGFRPASVDRLADGQTLVSGWSRGVFVDEDGDVTETFTHQLMNDAHEIQRTEDGLYLVASTGMDTLLLLDEDFEEVWRWHMWEHVDDATRPGQYYPHHLWYKDARYYALNPDDRYHLNYATVIEGEAGQGDAKILCSALNYGIFVVDMASDEVAREFTALEESHNPHRLDEAYAVAESGADRIVVVDWNERQGTLFEEGLAFCKDADPIGDGDWLVTDTKNNRVLVWNEDDPAPDREFHLGEDAKPYEADYLTGTDSFE